VDIADSAHRHAVPVEDMLHAIRNQITEITEQRKPFFRMLIGPARDNSMLENRSARPHRRPSDHSCDAAAPELAPPPQEGVTGMPRSREQLKQAVVEFQEWADNLDLDDPDVQVKDPADLRAIGQALAAMASAEQNLAATVAVARENGRSWAEIGMVLGVTREGARKRFAEPAIPRQNG
jgi:hypothetical protein